MISGMAAQSRITSQGQISVPAGIRRKLGVGPGSVLEWEEEGDKVVVRKAGRFSSEDIHRAILPNGPRARTIDELEDAVREHVRSRFRPSPGRRNSPGKHARG
jgi:AbrB family looped-hinge helix DNA binding protein